MASAGLELQKAIHTALVADGALTALLGGPYVYDDVPRTARMPYVTFAGSTLRDWSTGGEEGHEHILTLNVWSRANGAREAHDIASSLRSILHLASLTLPGHRLINFRHEASDTIRDVDGETIRGVVRYRAVTEPV